MLKKLRLDQTKIYEKYLILEELSGMLVSFVNGRSHHVAIGAEQGDVDKWDDIIIQTNSSDYIHLQAKRQTTDFSSDSVKRGKINAGPRTNELKDLSTLDETLKSLGDWIKSKPNSGDLQKEFWLELPDGSIKIKKRA
jgi:hypothetical protein